MLRSCLSWNDLKNRDLKCEEEIYIRTETHILHFIKKIFDDVLIKMTKNIDKENFFFLFPFCLTDKNY